MNSGRTPTKAQQPVTARDRGQAMRQAIHEARARASIDSDTDLALRAGIHYDTLMNWYSGTTTPRPAAVRKVAEVLDVPYGDLLAAYDGRPAAAIPLEQAVAELIVEIRSAVVDERRARAELMRAIAASIAVAISTPPAPEGEPAHNGHGR